MFKTYILSILNKNSFEIYDLYNFDIFYTFIFDAVYTDKCIYCIKKKKISL